MIPTITLVRPNRAIYMIIGSRLAAVNGKPGESTSYSPAQTTDFCGRLIDPREVLDRGRNPICYVGGSLVAGSASAVSLRLARPCVAASR